MNTPSAPPADLARRRVLSLNLAHGRATGVHQWLQSEARLRRNLGAVATGAGLTWHCRGDHAQCWLSAYGTAAHSG